jgi:hypothetical protein
MLQFRCIYFKSAPQALDSPRLFMECSSAARVILASPSNLNLPIIKIKMWTSQDAKEGDLHLNPDMYTTGAQRAVFAVAVVGQGQRQ